jgi:hypothetical protein
MIHDVDETLKALIRRDVVNGSGVDISFEAPTKEWAAKRTTPTISCYLYDIREDLSRRELVMEEVRDESGLVVERRAPPRRFKLSYLLTAWTQRPEDEHRLLSSLLGAFLRSDVLPPELLAGGLGSTGKPVITAVAMPPTEDRSISDVWSAMGGELKPSLDLAVIAPFDPGRVEEAGPPVVEQPRIAVSRPGTSTEAVPTRKGKGGDAAKAEAASKMASGARGKGGRGSDAAVAAQALPPEIEAELEELGVPTHTPEGKPLTGPARLALARKARTEKAKAEAAELSAQDETLRTGQDDQPGRIFRIRGLPRD